MPTYYDDMPAVPPPVEPVDPKDAAFWAGRLPVYGYNKIVGIVPSRGWTRVCAPRQARRLRAADAQRLRHRLAAEEEGLEPAELGADIAARRCRDLVAVDGLLRPLDGRTPKSYHLRSSSMATTVICRSRSTRRLIVRVLLLSR